LFETIFNRRACDNADRRIAWVATPHPRRSCLDPSLKEARNRRRAGNEQLPFDGLTAEGAQPGDGVVLGRGIGGLSAAAIETATEIDANHPPSVASCGDATFPACASSLFCHVVAFLSSWLLGAFV
jgi:hypothetical protein